MSLFNFAFGRPQPGRKVTYNVDTAGDVEMGDPCKALQSESAAVSQAIPALHVYPPSNQVVKPAPHSLEHRRPQTLDHSLTLSRSRSPLRPPSPQSPTATQPPRSLILPSHAQTPTPESSHPLLRLPQPQTPTQKSESSSAALPPHNPDRLALVAVKSPNSVRRRASDAEDLFTSAHGRRENQQLGGNKAPAETPVLKCRVMEIEDPNKEFVIESQTSLIQMLRVQLMESNNLMQAFRKELKEKDAESLKQQRAYEAQLQEVEAQLHQTNKGRSHPAKGYPMQLLELDEDEPMELVTPEIAATLSIAAQKQREIVAEDSEHHAEANAGRHSRKHGVTFQNEGNGAYDAEMDCEGDRRNARIIRSASPEPVPLTNVPKPRSYKKPRGGKAKLKSANQGVEEKLDRLLAILQGTSEKRFQATSPMGKTMYSSMFHTPTVRGPKAKGRNETLLFVRKHLHSLLHIEYTADISKYSDEIFACDTPLQRRMAAYEEHGLGEPDLEPMQVNWKVFNGRWNETLCERFVQHCVQAGLGEGGPNADELQLVTNIFWERLGRIRTWINSNAPKKRETMEDAEVRNAERHRGTLEVARRNTRRQQSYNSRVETCLSYLPGEEGLLEESTAAWRDHLTVIETLGVEGQSSDETDEEDPNLYNVRTLPWRSKELVLKVSMTDKARNTTNAYGNPRSGNRPRTRKRRKNAKPSQRKAPRGKPLNYYDRDWYANLTQGQRQALSAVPALPFLDTSFDDMY